MTKGYDITSWVLVTAHHVMVPARNINTSLGDSWKS